MTEVIQDHCGGYLNKFLGDGLFVFFGAPVLQEDHAARAVRAAILCQQEIEKLNIELKEEYGQDAQLACRIGVTTGEVMVGNCGSNQRMDYTAIGDSVNLASRLESANKHFGTRILVDGRTWREGGDGALARPLGKILVVGKHEPVDVWNVLAQSYGPSADGVKVFADQFARGIDLLAARNFAEAGDCFQAILTDSPDDKPAKIYSELARKYQADPPPQDWDGAMQLTEK